MAPADRCDDRPTWIAQLRGALSLDGVTTAFRDPRAAAWFRRRTLGPSPLGIEELARSKSSQDLATTVVLPALDEAGTIGGICGSIRSSLMDRTGIVDRLVVMDSGSSDGTPDIARASGAEVFSVDDIAVADVDPIAAGGKGAALWKSLVVTDSDLVVWIDSDIKNFDLHFVLDLLAPLLVEPELVFVKAFYDRPIARGSGELEEGGARVTELVARPLLNLFEPKLAGFKQPLSGECAGRREALISVPFFTGYGVDIGLLLDVVERFGLESVAQVDLGVRVHHNQDIAGLARMAHQVLQTMLARFESQGRVKLAEEPSNTLVQFLPHPTATDLTVAELPSIRSAMR